MPHVLIRIAAAAVLTMTATGSGAEPLRLRLQPTVAPPDAIDLPLRPDDPEQPLDVVMDERFTRERLLIREGGYHRIHAASFTHDGRAQPVTLLVDMVGTLPGAGPGEVTLDVGIECEPQCKMPITQGVMTFRSAEMGQVDVPIEGASTPVWVGRKAYAYPIAAASSVDVWLSLMPLQNFEPRLIRASVFYGEHDDTPLHGELDRGRIMLVIAGVVALVLLLVMWWLKRAR